MCQTVPQPSIYLYPARTCFVYTYTCAANCMYMCVGTGVSDVHVHVFTFVCEFVFAYNRLWHPCHVESPDHPFHAPLHHTGQQCCLVGDTDEQNGFQSKKVNTCKAPRLNSLSQACNTHRLPDKNPQHTVAGLHIITCSFFRGIFCIHCI